jgi:predicted DNA-binding transcriptional regulator AlpA
MQTYLDVHELAERLGLKVETIVRNAKQAPWRLPPRAQLVDPRMLRWNVTEVERWIATVSVPG